MSRPIRLAIVASHPVQYLGPWFRLLAQRDTLAPTVFFCCSHGQQESRDRDFGAVFRWSRPLTEGYDYEFVPSVHPDPAPYGFWRLTNPGLWARLSARRFDAVLQLGWGYASSWIAVAAAKAHGLRVLLHGESHLGSEHPRASWVGASRRAVLSSLFAKVDAFLTIGTANRELYRAYGVPEKRLFHSPYSVDNDFFLAERARLQPERARLRAGLGVQDSRPIIVASGKLIERKAPLDLLQAFAAARPGRPSRLVFVGDGELRPTILATAQALGVAADVTVTGFLQQEELCGAYVAADIMALPSRFETWGLVLNEGMLFGLPVVCSSGVAAHRDLVSPGQTGDVFPPGDIGALSNVLAHWLESPGHVAEMGRRANERALGWNLHECVDATVAALRFACSRR